MSHCFKNKFKEKKMYAAYNNYIVKKKEDEQMSLEEIIDNIIELCHKEEITKQDIEMIRKNTHNSESYKKFMTIITIINQNN